MAGTSVKDMGPSELRSHAKKDPANHDEAEAELRRRWSSYDNFLPKTDFVSILDTEA